MNYRCYTGPNAMGAPRSVIPDWLDHTANAIPDESIGGNTAASRDPGPAQPAAEFVSNTTVEVKPANPVP
jgi:hypothetical protein